MDALPGTIAAMSEPMVSYDNVGFYLLSKEVSKHIKVVQSGQGADEVFGGYHWYPPLVDSTMSSATMPKGSVTGRTTFSSAATRIISSEANERPGLANHEPQPTAARFLDLLFPGSR